MSEIDCDGSEDNLFDCDKNGWRDGECDHDDDFGVCCDTCDLPPDVTIEVVHMHDMCSHA